MIMQKGPSFFRANFRPSSEIHGPSNFSSLILIFRMAFRVKRNIRELLTPGVWLQRCLLLPPLSPPNNLLSARFTLAFCFCLLNIQLHRKKYTQGMFTREVKMASNLDVSGCSRGMPPSNRYWLLQFGMLSPCGFTLQLETGFLTHSDNLPFTETHKKTFLWSFHLKKKSTIQTQHLKSWCS